MLSIMIADYIISSNDNRPLQSHQSIVLAGAFENGEEVTEVTADGRRNLSCSNSDHEEADTRIIFHTCVTDADFRRRRTNGRIIIETPDTDVLVLAIHHFSKLSNNSSGAQNSGLKQESLLQVEINAVISQYTIYVRISRRCLAKYYQQFILSLGPIQRQCSTQLERKLYGITI